MKLCFERILSSLPAVGLGLAVLAAGPAQASCGDPNDDGRVSAADALYTLRAGVGHLSCALDRCDVDSDGSVDSTDALKVLRVATGVSLPLLCAAGEEAPHDPDYPLQWGLEAINAPEAWETRTDCSDVIIAVVDSGVDYFHDDLVDNLWRNPGEIPLNGKDDDNNGYKDDVFGWDFEDNDQFPWDPAGHGTHVTGIIGATANSIGVVGVCWNARIMALRFLSEFNTGFISDALQAVDYARKMGALVINNSWGGGFFDSGGYYAFKAASDAGITQVCAAGNSASNNDEIFDYPGGFMHVGQINVAATVEGGGLADFSNFGPMSVHIAAPGADILSTTPHDTYSFFSGTSMATPMVSGAAALLRAEFPRLSMVEIKRVIMESAAQSEDFAGLVISDGELDLAAAFELAEDIEPGLAANLSASVAQPAPATVRSRSAVSSFDDSRMKYSKLQHAVETYSNGKSEAVTMVADHVIVTLEDGAALGRVENAGLRIRRHLDTGQLTVLVDAPEGIGAAERQLDGIEGVLHVSPDYVVTGR